MLRQHENATPNAIGYLIFDDTIQPKPHTSVDDINCWHYDHTQNKNVRCSSSNFTVDYQPHRLQKTALIGGFFMCVVSTKALQINHFSADHSFISFLS